jgi:hypothetical protein
MSTWRPTSRTTRDALRGQFHTGAARAAGRLRPQFEAHLASGSRFSDPLLNLLAGVDPIPADLDGRIEIVRACRRAHAPLMIDTQPRFREMFEMVLSLDGRDVYAERLAYMNDQFFLDLLSWYHVVWLGHSLKRSPRVRRPARAAGPVPSMPQGGTS